MKPKQVNFELITDTESEPYQLLQQVRDKAHGEIHDARIAIAWRKRLKADKDGLLVLGKCIKVSDLHKEFADFDFIILLNREIWNDIEFTREKKLALLDHELSHTAVSYDDETGEPKTDERGRLVYRCRKHEIEEFHGVVARHGCYKRDLEQFAKVLLKNKKQPLFKEKDETTVSIGIPDETGKMQYTDPIPHGEFVERCEQIAKHGKTN